MHGGGGDNEGIGGARGLEEVESRVLEVEVESRVLVVEVGSRVQMAEMENRVLVEDVESRVLVVGGGEQGAGGRGEQGAGSVCTNLYHREG